MIEDSPTYRKIVKAFLAREGYEILTAASGEEGLAMVTHERPHLILCDYLLPGMRGDEVCKRVKMHASSRHIPVIMLTTRSDRKDITAGLDAGADDYVLKSQDMDILLLRVRNFLARGAAQELPELGPEDQELAHQRVLAIDDDRLFRDTIAKLLKDEGYEVTTAASGEEGLQILTQESFDLILVDFVMGGLQGDEVCRRLKASELYRDIPVMLLTSRSDKQGMIEGLNAGADDYIVKTTDIEVLKSRAKALIRRKYYQDENRRIQEELKAREIEAARAKVERDLAQEKARMADALAQKNLTLEQTNRKLKEAQTALIQAEKMVALGQLVAGIAHEINNPLAFVSSNLTTIERDLRDVTQVLSGYRSLFAEIATECPETVARAKALEEEHELDTALAEIASYTTDAREGLERVKHIVLSLRNFSRLDEGEIKVVDVTEGIESTLKIIHHLIKDRISIERDFAEVSRIECYPGPLNQVFMNLLVNACQAITDRGSIRIRVFTEEDTIRISFTDTGTGIEPELMPKIFDPFFTTKEVGQGTGLGLSMCYGIMQKHGGRILVESTPGKGSTFTMVLHPVLPRQDETHGQTKKP